MDNIKRIKVRKEHECDECHKLIAKGDRAVYQRVKAYLSNQLLETNYFHEYCAKAHIASRKLTNFNK